MPHPLLALADEFVIDLPDLICPTCRIGHLNAPKQWVTSGDAATTEAQRQREAIAQIVGDTATFFAANTPLVFGVAYDQVSMADVMTQGSARVQVRTAESAATDDYLSTMMSLADAVESLMSPRRPTEERSPLLFGETIHHKPRTAKIRQALTPSTDGRGGVDRYSGERSDLAEHLTALTEIVTRLQAAGNHPWDQLRRLPALPQSHSRSGGHVRGQTRLLRVEELRPRRTLISSSVSSS